ncbi:SPOR domain-containing protein [Altererythrobacter sp. H2]|uniref:tetratricopeptide repeat protein n=1 Tax=Altererythrobacter sp. H2 TaxID=3108391 RepID=UPI002B4BA587|nr:SPOR domain-containing protein [Altererythrobacter sp. H2]WRK95332.1 SPOR domain-containing protein [Altererythrobacter sp. H2]
MMHGKLLVLIATAALLANPAAAQTARDGSRAVVQPLPSPAVGELNSALRRISRNARDLDALLDAGFASLRLDDVEAAVGFFTRAQEIQPGNAQAKLGLAGAYLRSDRPVEAIEFYRAAEQAGASSQTMAADRGLAYDLVGDNAAAQQEYARALTGDNADEVRRRLALSQAIQGNREGFERTLYPLLEKQDFAAYRTRAFALAILGEEKEAIAITEAVMPADLAARISPYLNFMRRLTPAQQAAAANLGSFPRAAQIGRDDPAIAAYRASTGTVRSADAALAPSGRPLGGQAVAAATRTESAAQRRRPGRRASRVEEAPVRAPVVATVARATPAAAPVAAPPAQQSLPPAPAQPVLQQASTVQELPPVAAAQPAPAPAATTQPVQTPVQTPAPVQPPVQVQVATSAPEPASATITMPQPGFDLARVAGPPVPAQQDLAASAPPALLLPATMAAPAATPDPAPQPAPARVADAFADLATAPLPVVARAPDAVDITRIKPPREIEKKPEPVAAKPPPPPSHPSRHWVQLATGRDKAALRFDWRRFAGKAPDVLGKLTPHVTPWGQANRLLAGPYDSARAANAALAALKKEGLDGFTFTSEAGQAVDRLP